ncbi:hypothetical protein FO519_005336, partial [Halicephalobus sp. NKZ332]
ENPSNGFRISEDDSSDGFRKKRNSFRIFENAPNGFRIAENFPGFRITKENSLNKYRSKRSTDFYRYRYRIDNYRVSAAEMSPSKAEMNITKPGLRCSDVDRQKVVTESITYFGVNPTNTNKLPPILQIIEHPFSGSYEYRQKEYNDFADKIKDISENCFYRSSIEKIVDNTTGEAEFESEEYVDLYLVLALYFKNQEEKNGLDCFENKSLVCVPMIERPFNTCDQFQDFMNCDVNIYDNDGCPSGVRKDFCNFLADNFKRDEVIDDDCYKQLGDTCGTGTISVFFGIFLSMMTNLWKRLL